MKAALSTKHTPVTQQVTVSVFVLAALLIYSIQAANAQSKPVLPKCNMDSFVYNAAGNAENIYGDEGWRGPPPFNGFTPEHRLSTGFAPEANAGLTTGHGSYMPKAWGGDEWTGNEWSQSGPTGGNNGAEKGDSNETVPGMNGTQAAPAFDTTSMSNDAENTDTSSQPFYLQPSKN